MNIMRWKFHAIALCAVGLVACSDRPTATELERPEGDAVSAPSGPVAERVSSDPTAIPVGSPARIEFFGKAAASRGTLVFPLPASPVDAEQLTQELTTWLSREKQTQANEASDPSAVRVTHVVERAVAARTPDDVRALLGPVRTRIADTRSFRRVGGGLIEHTVSYRLDGREMLRVVTNTRQAAAGPQFLCATELEPEPSCEEPNPDSFDPSPIVADLVAMQSQVDWMAMELASLQGAVAPGECDIDRSAYVAASLAFLWSSGEAVYFAWRRDVPNTYKAVRVAALAYGIANTAYLKYRQCLRNVTRPRL